MKPLILASSINLNQHQRLSFREASSNKELDQIYVFRLKMYAKHKNYMLSELNNYGYDPLDDNSKLFMACLDDTVIATVRLRQYDLPPF